MAKYNVELYVQGKYLFDDVEADTEEEAIEQCKYGTARITADKTYYTDADVWEVESNDNR